MNVVPLLLVHPLTQQLASLVLWAGASTGVLLLNRQLLHYSTLQLPFCLALGHAGVALVLGRLMLVVFSVEDPFCATNDWRTWLYLAFLGAGWAVSNVLSYAALQQLSVPAAVFLQSITPVAAYAMTVLLKLEKVEAGTTLLALALLYGVGLSLWPARHTVSPAGILLQTAATILEALWCALACCTPADSHSLPQPSCRQAQQPADPGHRPQQAPAVSHGTQQRSWTDTTRAGSGPAAIHRTNPLLLLANSSPMAMLVLAVPFLAWEKQAVDAHKFRYQGFIAGAVASCMLACWCTLMLLSSKMGQAVLFQPSGVLARVLRDVCVVLASQATLNEGVSQRQWLGYALAQVAGVALCWGCSVRGGASSSRVGDSHAARQHVRKRDGKQCVPAGRPGSSRLSASCNGRAGTS